MKKLTVTKQKRQRIIAVGIVSVLLIILILFLLWRHAEATAAHNTSISSQQMEEELSGYLADYFANTSVATHISDEDMQTISEQISSGIIDSMTYGILSDEEKEELYQFVLTTVQNELLGINDEITEIQEGATVITQELLDYIDNTIVPAMTLQIQLTRALSESALAGIKSELLAQIAANKDLLEEQKAQLQEEIEQLSASTAAELAEQVSAIREKISENADANAEALANAISNLYGEADNSVTIELLLAQIQANTELTENQKTELMEIIANLQISTDADIEEVKELLNTEVSNRVTAIAEACTELNTTLNTAIEQLSQDITAKLDALSAELDGSLNGITFYAEDGHIYAEWIDEEGNSVTKKLDFAQ